MSVQFEAVKENVPKGFKIQKRSTDENLVTFKLEKPGMSAVVGGLSLPIFFVSMVSCSGVAGLSAESGGLDGGPAIALGLICGLATILLCISLIAKFFTQAVTVKITPELIQINDKKYDPKLFGGFMSGNQMTEWMSDRTTNIVREHTTTGLSWVYGGESVSLKGGFNSSDPSDHIQFLNRIVKELHPHISY